MRQGETNSPPERTCIECILHNNCIHSGKEIKPIVCMFIHVENCESYIKTEEIL